MLTFDIKMLTAAEFKGCVTMIDIIFGYSLGKI